MRWSAWVAGLFEVEDAGGPEVREQPIDQSR
jgi:hypothetical protein